MYVVNKAKVVVREEKGVGAEAEDAAGAAVDDGFAGDGGEKAGDEEARRAVGGRELDDAVAGTDARTTGSVQRDDECVVQSRWNCSAVLSSVASPSSVTRPAMAGYLDSPAVTI